MRHIPGLQRILLPEYSAVIYSEQGQTLGGTESVATLSEFPSLVLHVKKIYHNNKLLLCKINHRGFKMNRALSILRKN
jgi:hypothetical protein